MWRGVDEVEIGGGVEMGRSSKGREWCGEGQIK